MKALVVGGAGFVGSNLVRRLLFEGWEVGVIDNLSTGKETDIPGPPAKVEFVRAVADLGIPAVFDDVDCVFYLAAIPDLVHSHENPVTATWTNTNGVTVCLDDAVKHGIPRFVFASSWMVYGRGSHPDGMMRECEWPRPMSPYALTKWFSEEWCRLFARNHDVATCCLRLFNVYGPGSQSVISAFVDDVNQGLNLMVYGDGVSVRDFVHVDDVCDAFLLTEEMLRTKAKYWTAVNVGTGEPTRIVNLAGRVLDLSGREELTIGSLTNERVRLLEALSPYRAYADTTKARGLLGWEAKTSLDDGIRGMLG
jgi:UDP-glucose 4-epimerase